jgi:cytochrome d ubiquinol oxidase subunit I
VIEVGLIVRFARRGITDGDTTPTPGIGGGKKDDDDRPPRADDDATDDVLQFAY